MDKTTLTDFFEEVETTKAYSWLLVLLKMVKTDTLSRCLTKWTAQFIPVDRSQMTISVDGITSGRIYFYRCDQD